LLKCRSVKRYFALFWGWGCGRVGGKWV